MRPLLHEANAFAVAAKGAINVEGSRCLLTIAAAYLPPACPRVRGNVGTPSVTTANPGAGSIPPYHDRVKRVGRRQFHPWGRPFPHLAGHTATGERRSGWGMPVAWAAA